MKLQYLKKNRLFELFEIYSARAEAVQSYTPAQPKTPPPPAPSPEKEKTEASSPVIHDVTDERSDPKTPSTKDSIALLGEQFKTGEILYANSCILAALIKVLESKDLLTANEASELMEYERLSTKGASE